MKLSEAERELIEHIREGEVGGLTIQRVEAGGVVCMAKPPFDTDTAIVGIEGRSMMPGYSQRWAPIRYKRPATTTAIAVAIRIVVIIAFNVLAP